MSLDQCHLDVGQRRQLVLRGRVVLALGGVAPTVLREGEELGKGRGIDHVAVATAAAAAAASSFPDV